MRRLARSLIRGEPLIPEKEKYNNISRDRMEPNINMDVGNQTWSFPNKSNQELCVWDEFEGKERGGRRKELFCRKKQFIT